MPSRKRNWPAGTILLLLALAWIAGAYWIIPGGSGEGQIGPRGFPLAMGILLAVLALLLIGSPTLNDEDGEGQAPPHRPSEIWALAATFGFLGVYVVLLDLFGFLIATIAVTASFLVLGLNKRSPRLIGGMSFGLALGIWLVLGKAMGVYLPHGSIIDWF